jgi:hypothetical protein
VTNEQLRAENEQLRSELEQWRQRELEDLRLQLATAIAEREHYKQEAYRNAEIGRQIYAQEQEIISGLRNKLEAKERLENARISLRPFKSTQNGITAN